MHAALHIVSLESYEATAYTLTCFRVLSIPLEFSVPLIFCEQRVIAALSDISPG